LTINITQFKDEVIFITGRTSGIGLATAVQFAAAGVIQHQLPELKNFIKMKGVIEVSKDQHEIFCEIVGRKNRKQAR